MKKNREREIQRTRAYYNKNKEKYAKLRHERYKNSPKELEKALKRYYNLKELNNRLRKIELAYISICEKLSVLTGEPIKSIYDKYLEE